MKKRIENFMGILVLLLVLTVSAYYNRDSVYVCASKKDALDNKQKKMGDGSENEGSNDSSKDKNSNRILKRDLTIVIDPGHGETCGRPKNRSLEMLKNGHLMVLYRVLLKCDIS